MTNLSGIPPHLQIKPELNTPEWDGQEIYTWNGDFYFIYGQAKDRTTIIEYPGGGTRDIFYLYTSTFNKEARSATPEELESIA